jgi:molybdopterin/thiamine biosynthesis adenylyltransferase
MNDQDLLRYSRHILLDEIGIEGQEKILAAHVIIVGAGGLGSAAAPYIAAAGVRKITLIDHDVVDLTNLQRQIMHRTDSVGLLKVNSGKTMLEQLNPDLTVETITEKATHVLMDQVLPTATVVLDCTDNFTTRHLINAACVKHKVPLVSGAAIRFDGQLTVVDPHANNQPCYACLFPPDQQFNEVQCSTMGVFSPLVGIIGTMQAAQALQIIVGIGKTLTGQLLLWDGRNSKAETIQIEKRKDCPVCSANSKV